jgi:hypothetical protein
VIYLRLIPLFASSFSVFHTGSVVTTIDGPAESQQPSKQLCTSESAFTVLLIILSTPYITSVVSGALRTVKIMHNYLEAGGVKRKG